MGIRQRDHLAERDPRLTGGIGKGTFTALIGLKRFVDPPFTEAPDQHLLLLLRIGRQLLSQLVGTGMETLALAIEYLFYHHGPGPHDPIGRTIASIPSRRRNSEAARSASARSA